MRFHFKTHNFCYGYAYRLHYSGVFIIGISAESDPEPLCVPEPEVDLVDEEQLCVAGPSAPEVTTESTQKREVQLKADISSTISKNGNDQGGMNMSPATTEKTSPKGECQQTV